MAQYHINLKNGDFFTVEVEENAPAPLVYKDSDNTLSVANMPLGWSVDPGEILYIEPAEDDD